MTLIKQMLEDAKKTDFNTEAYFARMHQGDETAREKIILQWAGMVVHVINHFQSMPGFSFDDYFSVGVAALIRAVDGFDEKQEAKFSTYASRCIRNAIMNYIKANVKTPTLYYEDEISNSGVRESSLRWIDIIEDKTSEQEFSKIEDKCDVKTIMLAAEKILNPKELEILKLRYGFYNNRVFLFSEIKQIMGISEPDACELTKRAIKKLQEYFGSASVKKERKQLSCNLEKLNLVLALKDALKEILTETEYQIICLRFGVLDGVFKTQGEVASIMHCGRSTISEKETVAIEKLQAALIENCNIQQ